MKRNLLVSVVMIMIFSSLVLYRLDDLNNRPLDGKNFSNYNRVEIYCLGLLMGVLAYPIYPEVARLHLMLYMPFDADIKRLEDDFFLKSSVVKNAIELSMKRKREIILAWPASTYLLSFNASKYYESRVALALNGARLRVDGDEVIVRVKIKYPRKAFAPLIKTPLGTIGVEEGLFALLQREGWLYSGEYEWIANLN